MKPIYFGPGEMAWLEPESEEEEEFLLRTKEWTLERVWLKWGELTEATSGVRVKVY